MSNQEPSNPKEKAVTEALSTEKFKPDYESKRKQLRYGKFQASMLIFKSTVGVSIFSYHYAFGKVKKY